jgi:multiple sugar transport system ATP-binding protein
VIKGVDLSIADGRIRDLRRPVGLREIHAPADDRRAGGDLARAAMVIDGRDATAEPPSKRGLAMVFQSYALYPHMSVRENMGFSLKTAGAPKAEQEAKVAEAARVLRLEPYLERRPKDLSGGQRQRVAIGRSIVRDPTAFLFDEPLSNLDAALRVEMRYEIAKLHQHLTSTMIYVTHDQVEAMTLADRIVVLDFGTIAQVGTPRELYESPANLFVAEFIGSPKMNILPCEASGATYRLPGGRGGAYPGARTPAHLGVRPEHIAIGPGGSGQCDGVVDLVEYLGADTFVIVDAGGLGRITIRTDGQAVPRPGETVGLHFAEQHLHFFDAEGHAVAHR